MEARLFFVLMAFLAVACNRTADLHDADLIFVVEKESTADSSGMSGAILKATGMEGTGATHVGIIDVTDGRVEVIDASPRHGVSIRPLDEFTAEYADSDSTGIIVMRLKDPVDAEAVTCRARSLIGKAYDHAFLPDNDEIYCSELVQLCYTGKDGEPVFDNKPMNLKGEDGTYPEYWQSLYDSLGIPIPQGVPGTNPNDLMHSPKLELVRGYTITGRQARNSF